MHDPRSAPTMSAELLGPRGETTTVADVTTVAIVVTPRV
jgi:hypothetical protein